MLPRALLGLAFSSVVISGVSLAQEEHRHSMAGRSEVYAPRGVIATSQPLASAAGLRILQNGGNAVDATIAAAAVLNVVEPMMTGIGGDAFVILWSADEKRLIGLNASGRSGSQMTRDALIGRGHEWMPPNGAESITVPGALSGWAALLDRYGTKSLAEVLEPAIRIADEGFPVSPKVAWWWDLLVEILKVDEGFRSTFLRAGERAPREGEWFANPDFAATLRMIARDGPGALYGGELGRRIVERVSELGGFLTLDDLKRHRPLWVDPISVPYRGYRLWELPPNSQGIAALEMLRVLEPYDLAGMGHNSTAYLHHLIEAKKLAYADLKRFGVIGGAMQPQGHVQVLLNLLVFEMGLQEAIDAPRFRHLDGLQIGLEPPIPEEVRKELTAQGHEIVETSGGYPIFFGGAQAIIKLDRGWVAGSEPRLDSAAMGH